MAKKEKEEKNERIVTVPTNAGHYIEKGGKVVYEEEEPQGIRYAGNPLKEIERSIAMGGGHKVKSVKVKVKFENED